MPAKLVPALLLILGIVAIPTNSIAESPSVKQNEKQLRRQITVELDYLLYLPDDYESKPSWPVLLFLHGAGERGDNLELVKTHGPPKLIEQGQSFPFIVISPQCPKDQVWEPIELNALLDEIIADHNVDEDRIYVTGLSMGGFGTWRMAYSATDRIAAIAPVCGGGEMFSTKKFKHLPVWAFHGDKDTAVPVERSIMMVKALKKQGGDPKLTIYPGVGHDSWTATYANPKLYDWLLEHKRRPQTAEAQ